MRVGAPRPSGAGGWGDPGTAAGEVEGRRPGGGEGSCLRCARTAGLPAQLDWGEADQFITSPQVEAQARSKL